MGWSYTAVAGRTLERIENACRASRKGSGETSSNVYFIGGKCYFYEVTRCDQTDGGIVGTINLSWDNEQGSWAREVGTFRIDGKGKVVRGPKLFKDAGGRS